MKIALIAAVAENGVIGKDNQLIWRLSSDLKRFKALTSGHPIIMGRKTFESIGSKPLPNRRNIVISRNLKVDSPDVIVCDSIESALAKCEEDDVVFLIGGAEIYRQTIAIADILYLTQVKTMQEGDSYFPDFDKDKWRLELRENHKADDKNEFDYSFLNYVRK